MARTHRFNLFHEPVITTQRARVGSENFVFEIPRHFGGRIAVEQFDFLSFLVRSQLGDPALRERQRIVINDQPAKGQIGAVSDGEGASGLSADHFNAIGHNGDVLQIAQHEVLPVVWHDSVMSRRHNDPLFSGLQLGVNKPLQIKINGRHRPSSPCPPHTKTNQTDGRQKTNRGCRWKMNFTTFHGFTF
jgi:hypothetical protein